MRNLKKLKKQIVNCGAVTLKNRVEQFPGFDELMIRTWLKLHGLDYQYPIEMMFVQFVFDEKGIFVSDSCQNNWNEPILCSFITEEDKPSNVIAKKLKCDPTRLKLRLVNINKHQYTFSDGANGIVVFLTFEVSWTFKKR